jgi:hypothetical protein
MAARGPVTPDATAGVWTVRGFVPAPHKRTVLPASAWVKRTRKTPPDSARTGGSVCASYYGVRSAISPAPDERCARLEGCVKLDGALH